MSEWERCFLVCLADDRPRGASALGRSRRDAPHSRPADDGQPRSEYALLPDAPLPQPKIRGGDQAMKLSHLWGVVPLLASVSLLTLACTSPPEAEKRAADAAVSAATAAGADKYAPSEFAAMMAAVKKAEYEMSNKAYKKAKASYEAVKDLAEKATKAAAEKAATTAAAEKQIADLEGRWKELQGQA